MPNYYNPYRRALNNEQMQVNAKFIYDYLR